MRGEVNSRCAPAQKPKKPVLCFSSATPARLGSRPLDTRQCRSTPDSATSADSGQSGEMKLLFVAALALLLQVTRVRPQVTTLDEDKVDNDNKDKVDKVDKVECECSPPCLPLQGQCPWNRTAERSGCPCCRHRVCARQAGQSCDGRTRPCDGPLGLRCDQDTNTCSGPFHLRAIEVGHNSSLLRWGNYLPDVDQFSLRLMVSQQLTGNESDWERASNSTVGNSVVKAEGLTPNTLYFMRLTDGQHESEVVIVKTADGCLGANSTSYGVGESFTVGCDKKCICRDGGVAECEPRCVEPEHRINCQIGPDPRDECCTVLVCEEGLDGHALMAGEPQVIVTGRTPDSLTVAWDDFKVPGPTFDHGYVVEYRPAVSGSAEVPPWTRIPVENAPFTTIRQLRPNTAYEVRVFIWEDMESKKYGPSTEIMVLKTKDGCIWNERVLNVGEPYFKGCEAKCTCAGNDTSVCGNRCEGTLKPAGSAANDSNCQEEALEEDECCVTLRCADTNGTNASRGVVAGKEHPVTLTADGECPRRIPDQTGSCRSDCISNSDCAGQKCCLTDCGSTVCIPPKTSAFKDQTDAEPVATTVASSADPCAEVSCGANAACRDIIGNARCLCFPGFTGNPYDQNVGCISVMELLPTTAAPRADPCSNISCGPNAACREIYDNAHCLCLPGFSGNPYNEQLGCISALTPPSPPKSKSKAGCTFGNATYLEGETFYSGCESKCECANNEGRYEIACQPRCTVKEEKFRHFDSGCHLQPDPKDECCKVLVCETFQEEHGHGDGSATKNETMFHEGCEYKGKTYVVEEHFYDGCESSCLCLGLGELDCNPRCPATPPVKPGCVVVPHPSDSECCKVVICNPLNLNFTLHKPPVNESGNGSVDPTDFGLLFNDSAINATDLEDFVRTESANSTADTANSTAETTNSTTEFTTNRNSTDLDLAGGSSATAPVNLTTSESGNDFGGNETAGRHGGGERLFNETDFDGVLEEEDGDPEFNQTSMDNGTEAADTATDGFFDAATAYDNDSSTARAVIESDFNATTGSDNATRAVIEGDFNAMTGSDNATRAVIDGDFNATSGSDNATRAVIEGDFNTTSRYDNDTIATGHWNESAMMGDEGLATARTNGTEEDGLFGNMTTESSGMDNATTSRQKEMRQLEDEDADSRAIAFPKHEGRTAAIFKIVVVNPSTVRMQILMAAPIMEKMFMDPEAVLVLFTSNLTDLVDWSRHPLSLQHNVGFVSVDRSDVAAETIIGDLQPDRQYNFVVVRRREGTDPDRGTQFEQLSDIKATVTIQLGEGMCEFMGKTFPIGERIYEECQAVCDCLPGQLVHCEAIVCPHQISPDRTGCLEWNVDTSVITRAPLCCQEATCRYGSMCSYKGRKFHNLEKIPQNLVDECDQECKCVAGNVSCLPRCQHVAPEPPTDMECESPTLQLVPGDECCRQWHCDQHDPETSIGGDELEQTTMVENTTDDDNVTTVDPFHDATNNTTTAAMTTEANLQLAQLECVYGNATYKLHEQWRDGKGHRQKLCSCILLPNGTAASECQGGCPPILKQHMDLIPDCPPENVVIWDVPELCPYALCNKTEIGRGIKNVSVETLNATAIRVNFVIPNIYVGLYGHIEILYTTDLSHSEDTTMWSKEVFSGQSNQFESVRLSHEMTGLQPDTKYSLKVLAIIKNTKNMDSSEVITITMPPLPTTTTTTTTTTLPPKISIDIRLNVSDIQTTSATIKWRGLESSERRFIDGLHLRYKLHRDESQQWSKTMMIHRDVTSFLLDHLKPDSDYDVEAVMVPPANVTTEIFSGMPIMFRTLPVHDDFEFNLTLTIDKVTAYTVELIWTGVPYPEHKYINVYKFLYQRLSKGPAKDSAEAEFIYRPPKGNQFQFTVERLGPEANYSVWMEAILSNGKVRISNVINVTTKPGPIAPITSEKEKLEANMDNNTKNAGNAYYAALIVVAVIAALCALGFVILLVILLKKQSSAKAPITSSKSHSAYDNPTYKDSME